ncbi:hypothetical protein HOU00_gp125 [Caulobacter phage CcrPW]|uniref:Uncharacterized protein n=1 Tax=Caulobacter phage CcrPW TaxID=2283271 RepID=A0A385EBH2_9CAUD|nr:hypothetical protein HOU00_gp011 [Caulobacter phage CcrPW]YP_009809630.1 hypothetical protein HOU00_gp125 [Caulobacter phage CcrPW]AXQ68550.1 hypothetical protein CcrPW_gp011 [Caulobacter phage CcrPW]AXQ69000.1 hypothetical protein CcrPW_gp461 [Caulobacter phage CcrPW]
MTQRYRLADQIKVANEVSNLLYSASDVVAVAAQYETTPAGQAKLAKLRSDLIGMSAGALTHKPPAAVLETLVWVVELAQDRATGADFNTPQEALDEHDALAFVCDWLKAQGQDVSPIIGAQPSSEALAKLVAARDAAQAELDALEVPALPEAVDVVADVLRYKDAQGDADDVLSALARAGFKVVREGEA